MTTISSGAISGPEARGAASIEVAADGSATVELRDLFVVPGAPDVRLYITTRSDGVLDDAAVDLGHLPDRVDRYTAVIPPGVDPAALAGVIIHCKVYEVRFGSALLEAR